METIIINGINDERFNLAAKALRDGKLVAFPTETVYGLGADALNPEAVKSIYKAKGRPSDNPLIVHIAELSQLDSLVKEMPIHAESLIKAFWPGPLTLVFKKSELVPDIITAGLDTVAIRMPNNPIAIRLIEEAQVPVAAPSANLSGRPSPTTYQHVFEDLNGRIEYIIDGGPCKIGVESTVLDITSGSPIILRPGGVTQEMLEKVIGKVAVDTVIEPESGVRPRSPGMKYRHYSPKAEMILFEGPGGLVIDKINELSLDNQSKGLKTAVLSSSENKGLYLADVVLNVGSVGCLEEVASGLFDALRKFDEEKVDVIYCETFEERGMGRAIMNRLRKASAGKIMVVKGKP